MPLYAIGDLHLSLGAEKPMDIFHGWDGYQEKLRNSLSRLTAEDTLVLLGDTSWGMSLNEAEPDFAFLQAVCPAQKVLVKGNHDYWWNTVGKMTTFLRDRGLTDFTFLHNRCVRVGSVALCGTRSWFLEEEKPGDPQNTRVFLREVGRLETSLKDGVKSGAQELIAFLHYPPLYENFRCQPILTLLREYGVRRCFYGHLHGGAIPRAIQGEQEGMTFQLLSADAVCFQPVKILEKT